MHTEVPIRAAGSRRNAVVRSRRSVRAGMAQIAESVAAQEREQAPHGMSLRRIRREVPRRPRPHTQQGRHAA